MATAAPAHLTLVTNEAEPTTYTFDENEQCPISDDEPVSARHIFDLESYNYHEQTKYGVASMTLKCRNCDVRFIQRTRQH